jgi:hypothetical protein
MVRRIFSDSNDRGKGNSRGLTRISLIQTDWFRQACSGRTKIESVGGSRAAHEQQNRGLNRRTGDIEEIERNRTFRARSFDAAKLVPTMRGHSTHQRIAYD